MENVSLKTSLNRNLSNSSHIFILDVNLKKLYILIISSVLVKLKKKRKNERSIYMLSLKCLNFKFCDLKLCIKNNFIDWMVNSIQFGKNLTCVIWT